MSVTEHESVYVSDVCVCVCVCVCVNRKIAVITTEQVSGVE